MTKKVIIAVAIVVLILIVLLMTMGKKDKESATGENTDTAQTTDTKSNTEVQAPGDRGVRSFMELVGMGQDMSCTFSTDALDSKYPTNGTVYTSGGKTRVDTTSVVDNKELTYSMIDDGEHTYTWGSNGEGAFAMKMKHMDMTDQSANPNATETDFDYSQQVEYDCTKGAVDAASFVPPADIEFMDMEAMMESSGASMEAMNAAMEQYGDR